MYFVCPAEPPAWAWGKLAADWALTHGFAYLSVDSVLAAMSE